MSDCTLTRVFLKRKQAESAKSAHESFQLYSDVVVGIGCRTFTPRKFPAPLFLGTATFRIFALNVTANIITQIKNGSKKKLP